MAGEQKRRPSLRQMRVWARIQAYEDRESWRHNKWQRIAAQVIDLGAGFALGFGLGLIAVIQVLLELS